MMSLPPLITRFGHPVSTVSSNNEKGVPDVIFLSSLMLSIDIRPPPGLRRHQASRNFLGKSRSILPASSSEYVTTVASWEFLDRNDENGPFLVKNSLQMKFLYSWYWASAPRQISQAFDSLLIERIGPDGINLPFFNISKELYVFLVLNGGSHLGIFLLLFQCEKSR